MLFADDVVLVDENRMGVDQKFSCGDELWRQNVLGLGLSRSKMERVPYNPLLMFFYICS
jgi:hypothetical protein